METILVDEVNLHENLTNTKISNVHETTSDQFCCVQEIALCMWISYEVGNDVWDNLPKK